MMSSAAETGTSSITTDGWGPLWPRLASGTSIAAFAIGAFVVGAAVIVAHRPFSLAERGDLAIWDYIAQSILRGEIPYRDVIEIKSPGAAYLSAVAIAGGRLLGAHDVWAVRLFYVLLTGALSCVTFLVAFELLKNLPAAVIAFLVPLLPEHLATMIAGTQPKLPMILFGMLTLLFVARDRPFWAGLCSMLSCLCWQPGLLFTGTALLVFSQNLTSWRDLRAMKVVAGAAIPLLAVAAYFCLAGALSDLWTWTIAFNYTVYGPRQTKSIGQALAIMWRITRQVFRADIAFVLISAAGLIAFAARKTGDWFNRNVDRTIADYFPFALVAAALVYSAFCLIDFQGGPDLLPLFPFIGIFAGWFFVEAGRLVSKLSRGGPSLDLTKTVPSLVAAAVLLLLAGRSITYRGEPGLSLQTQQNEFQKISSVLAADDRIYVHGTLEIPVLLGKRNLNPFIMFDEGKDDFITARSYGGSFSAILDEIGRASPKVISLSRLRHVTHGAEFERWVLERYEELPVAGYDNIYVRKQ